MGPFVSYEEKEICEYGPTSLTVNPRLNCLLLHYTKIIVLKIILAILLVISLTDSDHLCTWFRYADYSYAECGYAEHRGELHVEKCCLRTS